jgi:hypothetical protein
MAKPQSQGRVYLLLIVDDEDPGGHQIESIHDYAGDG